MTHLEPWEKGSRKTAGQTGMCGGVSYACALLNIKKICFVIVAHLRIFTLKFNYWQSGQDIILDSWGHF